MRTQRQVKKQKASELKLGEVGHPNFILFWWAGSDPDLDKVEENVGRVRGEKLAKPVTTVQDCVSTFVSV